MILNNFLNKNEVSIFLRSKFKTQYQPFVPEYFENIQNEQERRKNKT